LDYVVGCIPVLGDVFDLYWKANQRNVALLRQHVQSTRKDERRARRSDWYFLVGLVLVLLLILIGSITTAIFLASWAAHLFFSPKA
jgi:hypothetical protein